MSTYMTPLTGSGDSYSAIGYDVRGDPPTGANPFGNAQIELGTSSGGPNWVPHTFIAVIDVCRCIICLWNLICRQYRCMIMRNGVLLFNKYNRKSMTNSS